MAAPRCAIRPLPPIRIDRSDRRRDPENWSASRLSRQTMSLPGRDKPPRITAGVVCWESRRSALHAHLVGIFLAVLSPPWRSCRRFRRSFTALDAHHALARVGVELSDRITSGAMPGTLEPRSLRRTAAALAVRHPDSPSCRHWAARRSGTPEGLSVAASQSDLPRLRSSVPSCTTAPRDSDAAA